MSKPTLNNFQDTNQVLTQVLDLVQQTGDLKNALQQWFAQYAEMLNASIPSKVTFTYGNGESREAQKRWDEIYKKSRFETVEPLIIKKNSVEGQTHVAVLIDGNTNTPFFSILQNKIRWVYDKGNKLTYLSAIGNFSWGLKPNIIFVEFFTDRIIYTHSATTIGSDGKAKTTTDANEIARMKEDNVPANYEQEEIFHDYGIVPVATFLNRYKDDNTVLTGESDLDTMELQINYLIFLFTKMVVDISASGTEIAFRRAEGSYLQMYQGLTTQERNDAIGFVSDFVRGYAVETDNYDNKQYEITQRTSQIEAFRKEFNEVMYHLIFQRGGIQQYDRNGTVQMTNDQVMLNTSTAYFVSTLKRRALKQGYLELIEIVKAVDPLKSAWSSYQNVEIETFVYNTQMELIAMRDPSILKQTGWTQLDIIQLTRKVPKKEAQEILNSLNKELYTDPFSYFVTTKDVDGTKFLIEKIVGTESTKGIAETKSRTITGESFQQKGSVEVKGDK